ncbi:MAG: S9 family peptidase [Acidobacteriota bacterium]
MSSPRADRRPTTFEHHGRTREDAYHWLRVDNWQEVLKDPSKLDPEVRAYLEAENEHAETVLGPLKDLRQSLVSEMRGRIKEKDSSVPAPDGPHAYYVRYDEGGEYPLICRQPREGGDEELLLDVNTLAEATGYCQLGGAGHSPDHRLLAYCCDVKGSEFHELTVLDLETREVIDTPISNTGGGFAWSSDSQHLFYTVLDDNHRPRWIKRHRLGTDPADDPVVFEEKDPGFFLGVGLGDEHRHVIIHAGDHVTSEVHVIPADKPEEAPACIAEREVGVQLELTEAGGMLYLLVREGDQKDGVVYLCPEPGTPRADWPRFLEHRDGVLLGGLLGFKDYLVRLEVVDALPRVIVHRISDADEHAIAFDEEAYALGLVGGNEPDTTTLRFSYSSPTTPRRTFDYDMESRDRELKKEQEIPSGHDPDEYRTERLVAKGHDGAEVPITLLYRKDTPLDGSAPVLLYGYGAYGISQSAGFSTACLSLVDRGFIHAMAHTRGGKDRGYRWYDDGKMMQKKNTFLDYISCAEHLIEKGYTSKGRICARGGSAGGMLMGAIANMRPELFASVAAIVPFVDVLTTMCDDELPLTPPEWPEWGNPLESEEAYEYIQSYSPYDQVSAQDYPNMLVMAGLTDPRVTYWEPAKWVAKLRELKTDDNLLLLRTEMGAGHGGKSGRFEHLEEVAIDYAFAIKAAGKA